MKNYLEAKGHTFESETDTEIIAKLIYHLYREHLNYSFRELVEQVVQQLVSAFGSVSISADSKFMLQTKLRLLSNLVDLHQFLIFSFETCVYSSVL